MKCVKELILFKEKLTVSEEKRIERGIKSQDFFDKLMMLCEIENVELKQGLTSNSVILCDKNKNELAILNFALKEVNVLPLIREGW